MNHQQIAYVLTFALALALPVQADSDAARAKGIKWLVQTQQGDGSFVGQQGLEIQATAAAVEAMAKAGLTRSPQYARALAWLSNVRGGSLDARAWQAAALAAAGRDATTIAGTIRDERNTYVVQTGRLTTGGVATWGAYPGYGASTIDTALAYAALRSAGVSYADDTGDLTVTVLCNILPAQLTASPWRGAWPYALPQRGQPPHATTGSLAATAIMLHELKKQRQAGRFLILSESVCDKTSPGAIDTAMGRAKTWLIAQANGDGGFAERNPQSGNLEASAPVSTALAIRALSLFAAEGDSTASSAIARARAWLVSQQNADGSWRGDPFITAYVLAALPPAVGSQLTDSDQDGLTDVVEQQLGSQVMVADAQGLLNPNANAVPGLTATGFSVTARLHEAFRYTIPAHGGPGPYTFAHVNGALPPGLTLSASGEIAGLPTAVGSYAFDYAITDAANAKALRIGRIDVTEPLSQDGDVPLPLWAVVALGAGLFALVRRHASRQTL